MVSSYERWINDFETVQALFAKHDVERAVDANGGLVRIERFFPEVRDFVIVVSILKA